uniref:Uncharacterized protein n=1 Tax=Helianthus annuus TaxID=4232 RepID=A0A251V070_HELAN
MSQGLLLFLLQFVCLLISSVSFNLLILLSYFLCVYDDLCLWKKGESAVPCEMVWMA